MKSKTFSIKVNQRIKPFHKIIEVDADKSISIRSFLIGAISQNISHAKNVLESEDVYSAIKCLKKLGVKIKKNKKKRLYNFWQGTGFIICKKKYNFEFW